MKIGIIAAVPEEIKTIHDDLHFHEVVEHAERQFHFGKYEALELVLVISRIGKVAASITTSALIERFGVDKVIFTGLAGAVSRDLNRGDVVLGDLVYQHDLDARPLCEHQFEVPLTGRRFFQPKPDQVTLAKSAIENFFNSLDRYMDLEEMKRLNIQSPRLHIGAIATGDQFIENVASQKHLHAEEISAVAVEVEGAAVAQVCAEYDIPYWLIRTISDKANESAHVNLQEFSEKVANHYASGIVQEMLKLLVKCK